MSYNISSKSLNNPLLFELLEKLSAFFKSIGSEFYIIGATARDIIISGIHDHEVGRTTADLDIAIAIPDWSIFQEISSALIKIEGFHKSEKLQQRFYYKRDFKLDIVPFGEIAKADNKIYWPPEENFAMSVIGFTQVAKYTLEVEIDNKLTVNVASLPGIYLLKLAAWRDRNIETNKDADDMAFIISVYLDINMERAALNHYDLFESEAFTTFISGATLLGRDISDILQGNPEIKNEFIGILQDELEKELEGRLINQILETHQSLKYEEVHDALLSMNNELNK